MIQILTNDRANKIGEFRDWVMVYIQAKVGTSVRIATDQGTLESPLPTGPQGIQVSNTDGNKPYWWKGPMWAIGDGPIVPVNFEFVGY